MISIKAIKKREAPSIAALRDMAKKTKLVNNNVGVSFSFVLQGGAGSLTVGWVDTVRRNIPP